MRAGGEPTRRYRLVIAPEAYVPEVAEQPYHRQLPIFCPERHLNDDGSFCLGLRRNCEVRDEASATSWWEKLSLYLLCQETAHDTGIWPEYAQLSHGKAGEIQQEAENVASELGLLTEYKLAVRYNSGRLIQYLSKVNKAKAVLINGRKKCVCGREDRRGRVKLRRKCRKNGEPCVVVLESQRRAAEAQFWEQYKSTKKCCGTMSFCPLRTC
jgi:hypothetical protein